MGRIQNPIRRCTHKSMMEEYRPANCNAIYWQNTVKLEDVTVLCCHCMNLSSVASMANDLHLWQIQSRHVRQNANILNVSASQVEDIQ